MVVRSARILVNDSTGNFQDENHRNVCVELMIINFNGLSSHLGGFSVELESSSARREVEIWNLIPSFFFLCCSWSIYSRAQCSGKLKFFFCFSSSLVQVSTEPCQWNLFVKSAKYVRIFLQIKWNMISSISLSICKWLFVDYCDVIVKIKGQDVKEVRSKEDQSASCMTWASTVQRRTKLERAERQWRRKKSTILWSLPTTSCSPAPGSFTKNYRTFSLTGTNSFLNEYRNAAFFPLTFTRLGRPVARAWLWNCHLHSFGFSLFSCCCKQCGT